MATFDKKYDRTERSLWSLSDLAFELRLSSSQLSYLVSSTHTDVVAQPPQPGDPKSVYFLSEVVRELRKDDQRKKDLSVVNSARARGEHARASKLETQNAMMEGTLTSLDNAKEKEAIVAGMAARQFDGIDMRVKRRHPDVSPAVLATIKAELAKAQNVFIDRLDDIEPALVDAVLGVEDPGNLAFTDDPIEAPAGTETDDADSDDPSPPTLKFRGVPTKPKREAFAAAQLAESSYVDFDS